MKKLSAFVVCCILQSSGITFAGESITGRGDTAAQACWNYNYKANNHARVNGSCWGKCVAAKVVNVNGKFEYTFNNPNHPGSCPKAKYDGGGGRSDRDFYTAFPPPAGITNPYAALTTPSAGTASYSFIKNFPAANQAKLSILNATNSEVRFDCEIKRFSNGAWGVYAVEFFIIQPRSSVDKGYHSFDKVEWSATCKRA